jgi:hypothetical protein
MASETIKPDIGPFPGKLCYGTQKAIERLKQGEVGDAITRNEMSRIIERPCDTGTKGYGNVQSAIKHVESNFQIVWRWDKGRQAWVRLNDSQCVGESRGLLHAARRRTKRSVNVAKAVAVAKLTEDERRQHSINLAVSGMVLGGTSSHFRKKLSDHQSLSEPDTQKLLGLFKRNGEG